MSVLKLSGASLHLSGLSMKVFCTLMPNWLPFGLTRRLAANAAHLPSSCPLRNVGLFGSKSMQIVRPNAYESTWYSSPALYSYQGGMYPGVPASPVGSFAPPQETANPKSTS